MKLRLLLFFTINLLALFWAGTHTVQAQISTRGSEFWVNYMRIIQGGGNECILLLSAEVATQVQIDYPGAPANNVFTINPGAVTQVVVPQSLIPTTEGKHSVGIRVYAVVPSGSGFVYTDQAEFSVFSLNRSSNRTEASSVLPVEALRVNSDSEYIIGAYSGMGNANNSRSVITILAIEDGTTVEVTPSANTGSRTAGVPFTETLVRGQLLQLLGRDQADDLTGTVVKSVGSCKPLAVFAGSATASIGGPPPCGAVTGLASQHLYEQQYPVSTWGSRYVLTPYTNVTSIIAQGVPFRVIAAQNDTHVRINGTQVTTSPLSKGQFFEGNTANYIARDGICIEGVSITGAPLTVGVAQYSRSQSCNGSSPASGDPSLLMLTPVNQNTKEITFAPAPMAGNPKAHYVNITVKTADQGSIQLTSSSGPLALGTFTPFVCLPEYGYYIVPITEGASYTLRVTNPAAGFGAHVYGYGGADAYAYSVGATFDNLSYRITSVPDNPAAVCMGEPFNFAGEGVGVKTWTWDFGDGSPTATGQSVSRTFTAPGRYTVRMTVTYDAGCGSSTVSKVVTILERPNPAASLGGDRAICTGEKVTLNAGTVSIALQQPDITYEWFKDGAPLGILTRTLDVTTAGTYRVVVKNTGKCETSAQVAVTVKPLPIVSVENLPASICEQAAPLTLQGAPTGPTGRFVIIKEDGTRFNSVTQFNAATLGQGTHQVRYIYTDPTTSCTDSATKSIVVRGFPVVNITGLQAKYCNAKNHTPIAPFQDEITLAATPVGGVFRLDSVIVTSFKISELTEGPHRVTYTYTESSGCTVVKRHDFEVLPDFTLNFVALADSYCGTEAPFTLQATPSGGTFTVNGTTSTTFNPRTLPVGKVTVVYRYQSSAASPQCSYEITKEVDIKRRTLSFTGLKDDYCITDAPENLAATPAGGKFFINSTEVTQLDPSLYTLGKLYVIYRYTDPATSCNFELRDSTRINSLPDVRINGLKDAYCRNDAQFTPNGTPAGGQFRLLRLPAPTGSLPTNITRITPSTLDTGRYELSYRVIDSRGCGAIVRDTFRILPLPEVRIVTPLKAAYCATEPVVTLQGSPTGGKFFIKGVEVNNLDPKVTSPGINIVSYRYTDPTTTCTNEALDTVEIVDPPKAQLGDDISACQSGGAITVSARLATHGPNTRYLWSTGDSTEQVTVNTPGRTVLWVRVSDKRACTPTFDTLSINIYPNPKVDLGKDLEVCDRDSLLLNASQATHTGKFAYRWSTGATTPQIRVKDRGTKLYWVEVSDNNYPSACKSRDTIRVTFLETPVVNLGPDVEICSPEQTPYLVTAKDLTHGDRMSYKWVEIREPSKTLSEKAELGVDKTGLYIVTVTDKANKCSNTDSISVILNPNPVIDLTGHSGPNCQTADTLVIQNTNVRNMRVRWQGPGIVRISPDKLSAIVNKSGIYRLTVTDSTKKTNCTTIDSVEVILADFPLVNLPDSVVSCQDAPIELNGALPQHRADFRYEWRNLRTGQVAGTSARLRLDYANLPAPRNFEPLLFSLTVTPPSGCLARDTVRVLFREKTQARIDTSYAKRICLGESLTLRANGGTRYRWQQIAAPTGAPTLANAQAATLTLRPERAGIYRIVIEARNDNANCPPTYDTATFTVNPALLLAIQPKRYQACESDSVEISAFRADHPRSARYQWRRLNPNGSLGPVLFRTQRVVLRFRDHNSYDSLRYHVSVADTLTGCSVADTVQVTFFRKSQVRIERSSVPANICLGDSVRISATGAGIYRWSSGQSAGTVSAPANRSTITVRPAQVGTSTYIVEGRFGNLCEPSFDTVRITVNPIPVAVANANKNINICPGERVTLQASGGVRYRWRHGDSTATATVQPLRDTWFLVRVFNQAGCSSVDSVLVRVTPAINLPPQLTACEGESLTLGQVSPVLPARYLWSNGDTIPVIRVNKAGRYTVRVTVGLCSYEASTEVFIREKPRFTMVRDTIVCFVKPGEIADGTRRPSHNISARLLAPKADERYFYEWYDHRTGAMLDRDGASGSGQLAFAVTRGGTYRLRVRSNFGCVWEDTVLVQEICEPRLKMPQAFTPNADGLNDFFAPLASDLTRIDFNIYDRWGNLVYTLSKDKKALDNAWNGTIDEAEGWDGTHKGIACQAGVYQYTLVWWGLNLEGLPVRHSQTGSITLVREINR